MPKKVYDSAKNSLHVILVNAVVFRGEKILISQRSWKETHMPGKWTIPGGKVEKTSGGVYGIIENTLKREVDEETGVKIGNEVHLITNNTFIRSTGDHVVALVFACKYKSGKARPLEDTIDCKWIEISELEKFDFAPQVKNYILLANKFMKRN